MTYCAPIVTYSSHLPTTDPTGSFCHVSCSYTVSPPPVSLNCDDTCTRISLLDLSCPNAGDQECYDTSCVEVTPYKCTPVGSDDKEFCCNSK
jgi:hypothetical protein